MLIAIMNDTYNQVMENKEQSSMSEKINILSDFRLLLMRLDLQMDFQYIFVVKPLVQTSDDNSLAFKLEQVRKSVENGTQKRIEEEKEVR